LPFGTLCGEFGSDGWVHGVAFSPSGNQIAWVGKFIYLFLFLFIILFFL
jgi:hypothetical protein